VTDALALGEKLLALLDESARTTTYKPALLLALIDRAQEYPVQESIPMRALAERVVELYWPQTLIYPTTGCVLKQSQTKGRAAIVQGHPVVPANSTPSRPACCRRRFDTGRDGRSSSPALRRRSLSGRSRACNGPTSRSSIASIGAGRKPAAGLCAHTGLPGGRSSCIPASAMH